MPNVLKCPSNQCLSCPLRCHRKQTNPVPPAEALQMLFDSCTFVPGTETVNVENALDRITAREYRARFTMPPVAGSHHDGITVHHASVTERIDRGENFLPGNEYAVVGMNDPIPESFDTVIPAERFSFVEGGAEIRALPGKGGGILPAGNMFSEGDLIVPEGHRLNAGNLFILRYSGNEEILVKKRPHAVILPTGNAMVAPGAVPKTGQFIESNSLLFKSMLAVGGATAAVLPPARDDPGEIVQIIRGLNGQYDMLILVGGAGRGQEKYNDYTVRAIETLGRILCWGTGAGPGGKSQFFAEIGGRPVLGMPGPGHAAVTQMETYLPPILNRFYGTECWPYPEIMAKLSPQFVFGARPGFNPHVRIVWEDGVPTVYQIRMGDNAHCFAEANAVMLPEENVEAGGMVRCRLVYDPVAAKNVSGRSWQ